MPCAEPTVRFGGVVARVARAEITLLHVLASGQGREVGRAVLASAQELLPDLAAARRIRRGDPAGRILAEIRAGGYDLVVVGASRRAALPRKLLGSVALQVVHRAPTSVLVVRQAPPALRRLLICTGGLDVAEPVIEIGSWLAEVAGASATLLHVASPVPSMYTGLNEVEETLPELLRTDTPIARHLRNGAGILARRRVAAELRLRYGVVADEILREAREGEYDLVVIGSSAGMGRLKGWLLGDVTRQVVEFAPCSVLVVRPARRPFSDGL